MSALTLAAACAVIDAALVHGRKAGFKPLTVVALGPGGQIVAAKSEDGSGIIRFQLAFGKAYGALGFGLGSRTLAGRAEKVPGFMTAAIAAAEGRVVPAPGGVLVRDAAGAVIGAIGISGDTGANDEACAIAGIRAAGLADDPGA